ncbi:CLUMA_CG015945, isoform A [Clunio marinus]|uniref:CLUMA_CG015945, isoform A n=1 Tax=Clunio marinus TaxID=568069 RepID=A0A1J1IQU5_9DIPT|nr:CLUMA_CG015945, isoform A [Clunio marinus]
MPNDEKGSFQQQRFSARPENDDCDNMPGFYSNAIVEKIESKLVKLTNTNMYSSNGSLKRFSEPKGFLNLLKFVYEKQSFFPDRSYVEENSDITKISLIKNNEMFKSQVHEFHFMY